jgi:outer membrane immunogenic protein
MNTKLIALLSGIIGLGAAGAASAADMAVKARPLPPPAPIFTWTGFYIGVNGGGVWNDTRDDVFPTGCFLTNPACGGGPPNNPLRSDSVRLTGTGWTIGGQAGYNWQADRWVFGIEGDINYNSINDGSAINRPLAAPLVGNFIHSETDKLQWFGTLRGRLGVAVAPNFLLYGTGGLAFGGIKSATAVAFTSTTDAYAGSIDDTRFGWTAGAGGEWLVTPNWSIKAEYLYIDLGKASYTNACFTAVCGAFVPPPSYQTDLNIRQHVARVGLNYHFGGPVVAKY